MRPEDREELTAFIDWLQSRPTRISPKTVVTYREAVEQLARFTARKGMPSLERLTREHIEDFLSDLHERGNRPATVRNRFASLRAFYGYMLDCDIVKAHPMAKIKRPQIPEQVQAHYPLDQVADVLATIGRSSRDKHALRDRAMILAFTDTGARCKELCDMRVGHVDREARVIEIVAGKGGKGRLVHYSSTVATALNAYMRARGGWDKQAPDAPLFQHRSGYALATNGVRMTLQRRFEAAGVAYRGTHGFRRTSAIEFLEAGGDPNDLKELMGWSSWSMLAKYTKATARSRAIRGHEEHSPVARMMEQGRGR